MVEEGDSHPSLDGPSAPPPGAAAFQSVEECVQALPAILDGGGAARTDAYAFLYSRLEAAADQEETPAELRGVVGAQHGPALVQHILQAIQAAVTSPVEHAGHTNVCLPLLTVLLSHECCCRALDASGAGGGGVKVLGKLVDTLLEGQRRLAKTTAPTSPPPASASAASAGASGPTASQEARVACLPLVDVCYNLLETLAYQRCDLSRSPDAFLDRLLQALQLAVDGRFGALAPSLPEQGLHAATRLLPRLQPLPGAAAKCRPLLKAVLRRALTVLNTAEAAVAVDVLRWAMQVQPTPLLSRDAPDEEDDDGGSGRGRESYHACILKHFDDAKALDRLAEADPTAALRLAGLLVRLLNPIDVKTQLVMHKLWPIIHRFLLDKDVEGAARLEALAVWADYVEALSQFWPHIARDAPAGAGGSAQHKRWQRRKQTFGAVVSFLGKSLAHLFKQQLSQPSERTLQLESHALALLNTLLSEAAWREWLWQPPPLGGASGAQQQQRQQRQQAGGEGQREQDGGGGSLQPIVLRLLATRHDGTEGDPGTLRFDAGLACLAELVPGALPRELLLRDRALRGWRRVAPLDAASQRALLTAAIAELSKQRVVRRFLEEQQRQQQAAALAAQAQATQSQMEGEVDAAAAVVTPQPRALQALLACWSHLLLRLLPAALNGHADDTPAAAIVDGALDVLRQRQGSKRPQLVVHKLADEALRLLGPSEAAIPRDSGLWRDVQERVYKQPPKLEAASATTPPLRLGALALGLKALLIRQDGNEHVRGGASTPTDPSATALALGGGDSPLLPLPLPQLVAFLEGMLARCVDSDGGVATPRPFLRLCYAALARLLELLAPQAQSTDKQTQALALAVLRLLPAFAAQGAVHVVSVIPTAEALKTEAGGPLLEQWANLFARCLARAEAPPGRSAAASSQWQSQLAQWAVEDPAEAVTAMTDAVLSPLLAPPQSSKAMAVLWLPLAHHALRGVNTALNSSSGSGGNTEGQRVRAALFTPALRLATALLKALRSVTAPGSSDLAVCVCDTCSAGLEPSSSSSSGAPTATRGQTWLGACLRPCPTAEEWRLEQVKELAKVLAAWWGPAAAAAAAAAGGGEAGAAEATVVPPCRVALAKDAARIADRFLDGVVGKSSTRRASGSLGGGTGSRGLLRPPAAPGKALEVLEPLLLALLTHGGGEGKTRVQALWQGAELGKRADLGLGVEGMKTQPLCGALQRLVRSGAIASLDPALSSKGSSGGDASASNGNGGGRRPSSSSSSSSKSESPVVRKRPSSSGSANGGGGGGGAGTPGSSGAAAKRAKG